MTRIDIAEAEARLADLIARAERGEEIVITRDGDVVARLVAQASDRERSMAAFERIRANAQAARSKLEPPATVDEILNWRNEGRR